jgi:hypothetical protein
MEFPIGHHCRQTDALEKPDFVFKLHVPNVRREGSLLQPNCPLVIASSQEVGRYRGRRGDSTSPGGEHEIPPTMHGELCR